MLLQNAMGLMFTGFLNQLDKMSTFQHLFWEKFKVFSEFQGHLLNRENVSKNLQYPKKSTLVLLYSWRGTCSLRTA